MKQIKVDIEIKSDKELLAQVERINLLLEEEIGRSASDISAEWRFVDARGEQMLELTISDGTNKSSMPFSRPGLSQMSVDLIRILLIRLWGDLLQERSGRQMEKLMQNLHALQEG